MGKEAKVITFGVQKGGSSKTMSVGITSYLLSQQYKVLAIDLDSQGNLTRLLTQRSIYDFEHTALDSLKEQDAKKYVVEITDSLHILTSNDFMATFPRYLYTEYTKTNRNINQCLARTIENVKEEYDFILIDTPPALSEHTINSMCASDYVVVLFETHQFCYEAIDRFVETFEYAKKYENPKVEIIGILPNVIDIRRADSKEYIEAIDRDYPGIRFDTIIKRQASTSRLVRNGFRENKELEEALKPYQEFVKELLERVHRKTE